MIWLRTAYEGLTRTDRTPNLLLSVYMREDLLSMLLVRVNSVIGGFAMYGHFRN